MPYIRVQIRPILALALLTVGSDTEARRLIPAWLLARVLALEGGQRTICPPAAVAALERWLCETGGSEFRKATTFENAMRAAAHVTCVWQEASEQEVEVEKERVKESARETEREMEVERERARENARERGRKRALERAWEGAIERERKRACPGKSVCSYVQICPSLALSAVSVYTSAEVHNLIPHWLLEPDRFLIMEQQECPPEAVLKLEEWLRQKGSCVLHRQKSRDHALRAVAKVTRVWHNAHLSHRVSDDLCRFGAAICCGRCYSIR